MHLSLEFSDPHLLPRWRSILYLDISNARWELQVGPHSDSQLQMWAESRDSTPSRTVWAKGTLFPRLYVFSDNFLTGSRLISFQDIFFNLRREKVQVQVQLEVGSSFKFKFDFQMFKLIYVIVIAVCHVRVASLATPDTIAACFCYWGLPQGAHMK